eukprot:291116-Ditylum_brightwellii.AAC.1
MTYHQGQAYHRGSALCSHKMWFAEKGPQASKSGKPLPLSRRGNDPQVEWNQQFHNQEDGEIFSSQDRGASMAADASYSLDFLPLSFLGEEKEGGGESPAEGGEFFHQETEGHKSLDKRLPRWNRRLLTGTMLGGTGCT